MKKSKEDTARKNNVKDLTEAYGLLKKEIAKRLIIVGK